MRKVVFMALATVFVLSSGFADKPKVENFEDFQTCNYSITRTTMGANGLLQMETKFFSIEVENDFECHFRAIDHKWDLVLGTRPW